MTSTIEKEAEILLIEDNEGDIVLTLEAFHSVSYRNKVTVVRDGEAAFNYLNKTGSRDNAPTPDLIILDINLPKVDGKELLAHIKEHEQLKCIPVIVLTTSSSEKDVHECYNLHANCFIPKPVNFNKFIEIIQNVSGFWLSIAKLPSKIQ